MWYTAEVSTWPIHTIHSRSMVTGGVKERHSQWVYTSMVEEWDLNYQETKKGLHGLGLMGKIDASI